MMNKTKCNFCKYETTKGCMVTPNSFYCKKANDEYWLYVKGAKLPKQKSLRSWDKNR